jgi:hypothetical protein
LQKNKAKSAGNLRILPFEKGEGKKMNRQFQLLEYPENVKKESV